MKEFKPALVSKRYYRLVKNTNLALISFTVLLMLLVAFLLLRSIFLGKLL